MEEISDLLPGGGLDKPDSRDHWAEHVLGKTEESIEIPENIKLKFKEGDQGNSVMCTCFSAYHAAQIANEYEYKIEIRPNFIKGWSLQGKFGTRVPQGDYVQTALKSLVKNGLFAIEGQYNINGYARIRHDEIDYWLAKGHAIVTSAMVTKTNFRKAKDTGIWGGFDNKKVGGHAFVLVGKDVDHKIASNSYGENWGYFNDGTFKIKNEDVKHLGSCYVVYDNIELEWVYKDVSSNSPHAEAIKWARAKGYMKGYKNGRFGPNDPLTRAQAAEVFYRILNK